MKYIKDSSWQVYLVLYFNKTNMYDKIVNSAHLYLLFKWPLLFEYTPYLDFSSLFYHWYALSILVYLPIVLWTPMSVLYVNKSKIFWPNKGRICTNFFFGDFGTSCISWICFRAFYWCIFIPSLRNTWDMQLENPFVVRWPPVILEFRRFVFLRDCGVR